MISPPRSQRLAAFVASACVLVSAASLVAGFLLGGAGLYALPVAAVAAAWLAGQWRGWRWVDTLGLAGSTAIAALGAVFGLNTGWMLGGLAGALAAWDLAAFSRWVQDVEPPDQARRLTLRHLGWVAILLALGLLLGALALRVRLRLSLPLMLLLGLVLVLGISQAVRFLRSQEE